MVHIIVHVQIMSKQKASLKITSLPMEFCWSNPPTLMDLEKALNIAYQGALNELGST